MWLERIPVEAVITAADFPDPGNRHVELGEGAINLGHLSRNCLAREKVQVADGFVIFTSRVSVEMIQKAAAIGVPVVVAISAPTALAVRLARAAGITLVAVARNDGFEVFTHAQRILSEAAADVA